MVDTLEKEVSFLRSKWPFFLIWPVYLMWHWLLSLKSSHVHYIIIINTPSAHFCQKSMSFEHCLLVHLHANQRSPWLLFLKQLKERSWTPYIDISSVLWTVPAPSLLPRGKSQEIGRFPSQSLQLIHGATGWCTSLTGLRTPGVCHGPQMPWTKHTSGMLTSINLWVWWGLHC